MKNQEKDNLARKYVFFLTAEKELNIVARATDILPLFRDGKIIYSVSLNKEEIPIMLEKAEINTNKKKSVYLIRNESEFMILRKSGEYYFLEPLKLEDWKPAKGNLVLSVSVEEGNLINPRQTIHIQSLTDVEKSLYRKLSGHCCPKRIQRTDPVLVNIVATRQSMKIYSGLLLEYVKPGTQYCVQVREAPYADCPQYDEVLYRKEDFKWKTYK